MPKLKVSSGPPRMPPHWSFSRWQTYTQCPRKAKLQYIDGLFVDEEDEKNKAARRGTVIHKTAEDLIMAKKLMPTPPIFTFFKQELKELHRLRAVAEVKLGITRDWEPCEFDAKDYWWHGALDAVAMTNKTSAWVVDWKSGRIYPQHKQQLEVYALVTFLHDEWIERVTCEDLYVDQKKKATEVYERSQVPRLITLWERRTLAMFNDTTFAPCPSNLCGWCPYRKELGTGLCEYGGK